MSKLAASIETPFQKLFIDPSARNSFNKALIVNPKKPHATTIKSLAHVGVVVLRELALSSHTNLLQHSRKPNKAANFDIGTYKHRTMSIHRPHAKREPSNVSFPVKASLA